MILHRINSNRVWVGRAKFSLKLHSKVFFQKFRCAVALWRSWVCKYSIRFQVIKLKLLCETLKNEKFLLDAQRKCGDIANEIPNAAIDDEQTFKCNWPYINIFLGKKGYFSSENFENFHQMLTRHKLTPADLFRKSWIHHRLLCKEVLKTYGCPWYKESGYCNQRD